jgi:hypothetical protein
MSQMDMILIPTYPSLCVGIIYGPVRFKMQFALQLSTLVTYINLDLLLIVYQLKQVTTEF